MPIQPGQRIRSVSIKRARPGGGEDVDPSELFAEKRVVMFSLPGAFTPTCSSRHLPGYLERYDELRRQGIDLIVCLSVNDHWVMQAWAEAQGVGDRIVMLADGAGRFTRALGLLQDKGDLGMRAARALLTIQDGVVESIDVEAPGKLEASSAEACLARLG